MASPYRGVDVLKVDVRRDEQLVRTIATVREAIRAAGLLSMYGDDRSMSVTVLEGVDRPGHLDFLQSTIPLIFFTADELVVSRIVDASTYDILDRVAI
jgi:hypothetical protein